MQINIYGNILDEETQKNNDKMLKKKTGSRTISYKIII